MRNIGEKPTKIKLVKREGCTSVIANESVYYAKNIYGKKLKGKTYVYKK